MNTDHKWLHTTATNSRSHGEPVGIDLFDDEREGFVSIYQRFADGTRWPARLVDVSKPDHFSSVLTSWVMKYGRIHVNDSRLNRPVNECFTCYRPNEFTNQCCCDKHNLPTLSAPPGRRAAYIVVAVDFPEDVTPAAVLEDFLRLGDKWYGPTTDMRMKACEFTDDPRKMKANAEGETAIVKASLGEPI